MNFVLNIISYVSFYLWKIRTSLKKITAAPDFFSLSASTDVSCKPSFSNIFLSYDARDS